MALLLQDSTAEIAEVGQIVVPVVVLAEEVVVQPWLVEVEVGVVEQELREE